MIKRLIIITHLYFVLLWPQTCISQSANQKQLDTLVLELMSKANIPGLSLAVIDQNSLAFVKGYGVKEKIDKNRVDENTLFEAASLTKPVFTYAVCRLAEQGKFDIDKPLEEYWTYQDAQPEYLRKNITARHVMTHTTGFRNWRPKNSDSLHINFDPGSRFSYSGEGFVFLSKVIEHITGMPTHEWVDKMVFKPLNMKHSTLIWDNQLGVNSARPHNREGEVLEKYKPDKANAAASLHTTASDFAKFLLALLNGQHISPEAQKEILSTQQNVDPECSQCRQPNSDPNFRSVSWGLGIGLEHTKQDYIWHWGDNGNFKAYFCVSLTNGKGLVYFANSHNGLSIRDRLVSAVLPGDHPAHRWVKYQQIEHP